MKKSASKHIQKVVYTILIAFAIICFWRGIWGLMDEYLFPSNKNLSYIISLLLGVTILYSTKNLIRNLV